MRVLALSSMVAATLVLAAAPARADFLLGIAGTNELMGTNFEWAGEASSTYIVLGAYQSKTGYEIANMTGYLGHRRYIGGSFQKSTFFGGFVLGDLAGGDTYNRPGIGGEIGYQWLTENLRVTAQGGMAIVGEASGIGAPLSTDPEPISLIGVSANIRF